MRTIHTTTAYSGEWEDFADVAEAREHAEQYYKFQGDNSEQVILIIADDDIVVAAAPVDDLTSEEDAFANTDYSDMIGKHLDQI